jgi:hypothetical protein
MIHGLNYQIYIHVICERNNSGQLYSLNGINLLTKIGKYMIMLQHIFLRSVWTSVLVRIL